MKILLISYHFAPYNCMGAVRVTKIAEKLISEGHDVKVLSADNQKLPKTLETSFDVNNIYYTKWFDVNSILFRILGSKKINNIKSSDGSLNKTKNKKQNLITFLKNIYISLFHIPDAYIGWYMYAIKEYEKISTKWKADIIYSSATPYTSHIIAKKISSTYNIPWIAELRDLWSDNHYRKTNFFDRYLEKKVLSKANSLVSVTNEFVNILKKKYNQDVYLIRNGYDSEDFDFKESNNINNNKIKIVHMGSLYQGKRDPTILFDLLCESKNLQKLVVLEFYGSNLDWLNFEIKKRNLENCIKVFESVSRKESLSIQSQSDILLLLTWNNKEEKGVIPGKFYEYIGVSKPILSIGAINNEVADIIKNEKFGLASNNKEEIETFIFNLKYFNMNIYLDNKIKYNRDIQLHELMMILEKYAKK